VNRISGQTFYTFVLENLESHGREESRVDFRILFQASFTALTGYGLGIDFHHAAGEEKDSVKAFPFTLLVSRICGS
jgi:hypothetical protein